MTSRRKFPLSLSGLSIALALGLALWEWYFFFVVGTPPVENVAARLGFFIPNPIPCQKPDHYPLGLPE